MKERRDKRPRERRNVEVEGWGNRGTNGVMEEWRYGSTKWRNEGRKEWRNGGRKEWRNGGRKE